MSAPLSSLEERTALVCGASQGIGRATAEALAAQGARVLLLARDEAKLLALARDLEERGAKGTDVITCDLSQPASIDAAVARVHAITGTRGVDVLVNNAGGPKAAPLLESEDEAFLDAMRVHVLAAGRLARAFVPGMMEREFGRIVNVISTSVRVPIPGLGVSNTTRAAMAGWAKTLAGEVAPFGITVNNVLPGYTLTERFRALVASTAQRQGLTEAEVEAQWRKTVPAGRFAFPKEVASAVCFFASPAAGYVTGQSLAVDGGRIGAI